MQLSLWLSTMKNLTGVLLTRLEEEKRRGKYVPQQSTSATLFSNFHHEIAFMKSSSHGGEQGQISRETEKAKIHLTPSGYLEGEIQGMLKFWNNQALSQLLVSLP